MTRGASTAAAARFDFVSSVAPAASLLRACGAGRAFGGWRVLALSPSLLLGLPVHRSCDLALKGPECARTTLFWLNNTVTCS